MEKNLSVFGFNDPLHGTQKKGKYVIHHKRVWTHLRITKHIFTNIKYSKTRGSLEQHPPELHFIEIYRPAGEVKNKEN
jgi:hypothetical protein